MTGIPRASANKPHSWPLALALAAACLTNVRAGSIEFAEVAVPASDAEKRAVNATPWANVNGNSLATGYHVILRSGDKPSPADGGIYGQLLDRHGHPIYAEDGSPRISNAADFSSLLKGSDGRLYMVSHFEDRPAAMYLTELKQSKSGELSAQKTKALDFSGIRGGWVHCSGSVTPWGSHLGGEEYPPNARLRDPNSGEIDAYYKPMADYFDGDLLALNPYDYGYPIEVKVKNFDQTQVRKHYAMGRAAIELAYVMPNRKTAYISDDGSNVGLYRFEADKKDDLSAGTLYAAKWRQTGAEGAGSADIAWVNLGHASDKEIQRYLDDKLGFFDLFETDDPADGCAAGFSEINTTDGRECLKMRDGMEKAASRLETRRYAAMLGATTEWRKMEGISYNPDARQLYISISEIASGMEDGSSYDAGGPNDIRLGQNPCGAVYALDLDQNFVAGNMYGLLAGTPSSSGDGNNSCALDGLASPDNISYLPGYHTLVIGEDSGSDHQNDAIWAYNLEQKKLTRIFTSPYGSETTSPYFYPDLNGYAYLMAVVQHPYGESDRDKLDNPADLRAYTGYIGPLPALNDNGHSKKRGKRKPS